MLSLDHENKTKEKKYEINDRKSRCTWDKPELLFHDLQWAAQAKLGDGGALEERNQAHI